MVKQLYKQVIEHIDEFPSGFFNFDYITPINETRENNNLCKTDSIENFMKRKPRFEFYVYLKNKSVEALPTHRFIYSKKSNAEKAYKACMKQWIDEQIEPYRKIVESGKSLTIAQMEKCEKIQNLLKD